MSIYKQAIIMGLTFPSTRGSISLVQLATLPLTGSISLDSVSQIVLAEKAKKTTESLVTVATKEDKVIYLQIEILTDLIADAKAKIEMKAKEASKKEQLSLYTELLKDAEKAEMSKLSPEELKAKIAELSN